jgi:energy-coupling factor transporter ATP-binding protein EcfA2
MNISESDLKDFLKANEEKRICVVGTSCSGKSTLVKTIPGAIDMDSEVFVGMSREDFDFVCQTPWTPEISVRMEDIARRTMSVEPGKPVFGTVVLDCDLVVVLTLDQSLLRERCEKRNVDFQSAADMESFQRSRIAKSQKPVVMCALEREPRSVVLHHIR